MHELAALLSFFVAFALLHASSPGRFPSMRVRPSRTVLELMKLGAFAACAVGVCAWSRSENTAAALLVAISALSLSGTLFVLLAPVFPRAVWSLALWCAPMALALECP